MGKLLSGRYGSEPEAESIAISLSECNQKLSLKPSDFVSEGAPTFFEKNFGSASRYLLFKLEPEEVKDNRIWRPGYYLLPLEAKDVLAAIDKKRTPGQGEITLPIEWEDKDEAPDILVTRAMEWGRTSQPLFFKCSCKQLSIRLYSPWALRRRWKARLRCPGKCQPPITTLL